MMAQIPGSLPPMVGDPDCILSSWMCPGPDLDVVSIWRMNQWMEGRSCCVSLYLSNKVEKKKGTIQALLHSNPVNPKRPSYL